ncbi:MAG: hypothetical protein J0I93_11265 [Legionella sp.]|nr:hypothetical protein [Legionella sp.]
MHTVTVDVHHKNGQLKSAEELIQILKEKNKMQPTLVYFDPRGASEADTVRVVLTQLPKTCVGVLP